MARTSASVESVNQSRRRSNKQRWPYPPDLSAITPKETVDVHCDAPDLELLLVSWLNEVIYETAVRRMLLSEFHVLISGTSLTGTLAGEGIDADRQDVAALKVARQQGGWVAQCVVDV